MRKGLLGWILGLAFLLRVTGIQFGLPHLYHADEPIVVNHAVAYGSGDLNPYFFKLPPLVSYLLFLFYGLAYGMGRATGIFKGVQNFERVFFTDPSFFYLSARLVFGVLMGIFSIFIFYRLIRRHFSERHALLSSFFLSIVFLHVRDCHYVYTDIPLLLVLMAGFFPLLQITEGRNDLRIHLMMGGVIGLATATKYNGVMLAIPYGVASLLNPKRGTVLVSWLVSGVAALLIYSLANPFTWLDFPFFWSEIRAQAAAEGRGDFFHHLTYSLNGGIGPGFLGMGLLGLFQTIGMRDKKRWAIAFFVISYYLVLGIRSQPYDRYVLPMVPFILFFASDFLCHLSDRILLPWKKAVLWILVLIGVLPTLTKSVVSDLLLLQTDVRTIAKEWVEGSIEPGTKLALGWAFLMPRLYFSKEQLVEKLNTTQADPLFSRVRQKRIQFLLSDETSLRKGYWLYFLTEKMDESKFLFDRPNLPYDLDHLKKEGIQYVLLARVHKEYKYPEFYKRLHREATLVKRFSPYRDISLEFPWDSLPLTGGPFLWKELIARSRNGQPIEVYKLK